MNPGHKFLTAPGRTISQGLNKLRGRQIAVLLDVMQNHSRREIGGGLSRDDKVPRIQVLASLRLTEFTTVAARACEAAPMILQLLLKQSHQICGWITGRKLMPCPEPPYRFEIRAVTKVSVIRKIVEMHERKEILSTTLAGHKRGQGRQTRLGFARVALRFLVLYWLTRIGIST